MQFTIYILIKDIFLAIKNIKTFSLTTFQNYCQKVIYFCKAYNLIYSK